MKLVPSTRDEPTARFTSPKLGYGSQVWGLKNIEQYRKHPDWIEVLPAVDMGKACREWAESVRTRGKKHKRLAFLAQVPKSRKAIIIGGGTSVDELVSMTNANANLLDEWTVITCNRALIDFPLCDINVYHDKGFEDREFDGKKFSEHINDLVTGGGTAYVPSSCKATKFANVKGVIGYDYIAKDAKKKSKNGLFSHNNCGTTALSLAVKLECKEIVLIGIDMRYGEADKAKRTHYHDGYAWEKAGNEASLFATMVDGFRIAGTAAKKKGVKIYNCSPISLLDPKEEHGFINSSLEATLG